MGIKLKIKQAISFLLHGEPDIVQVNLATLAVSIQPLFWRFEQ
jgi:hypothetical protein